MLYGIIKSHKNPYLYMELSRGESVNIIQKFVSIYFFMRIKISDIMSYENFLERYLVNYEEFNFLKCYGKE